MDSELSSPMAACSEFSCQTRTPPQAEPPFLGPQAEYHGAAHVGSQKTPCDVGWGGGGDAGRPL
eukprot:scaffold13059_cov62-Phaeocystis_antarctica.AAC.4